jgi:hypothetical protein
MQPDTRTILRTGIFTLGTGIICVLCIELLFGGVGRMGPHTNAGWLALIIAMGCLPTGTITLILAALKLYGDRRR